MKYVLLTMLALGSFSSIADNSQSAPGQVDPLECACVTCLIQNGVCVRYDDNTRTRGDVSRPRSARPTAPTASGQ